MKILIIEGHLPSLMPEGPNIEQEILGEDVFIKCYGMFDVTDYNELTDADAVIVRTGQEFGYEAIKNLSKAKVIVSIGVGYDHIDLSSAKEKNIPVCNVPDYGTEEVADTAMAMLLAHQRKINNYHFQSKCEPFDWDWRIQKPIHRSNQMNVGIIGLGRIGTALAMRLKPFGYKVQFFDPNIPRGVEKALGIQRLFDPLTLIRECDAISIHTPLNKEMKCFINDNFFNLLKQNAIILNTARGGIFNDLDVIENFMRKKPGLRIATDVLPTEPPLEHSLLTAWANREAWLQDRLIITSHSSFYSEEACFELRKYAIDIVYSVLNGGEPYNVVNK